MAHPSCIGDFFDCPILHEKMSKSISIHIPSRTCIVYSVYIMTYYYTVLHPIECNIIVVEYTYHMDILLQIITDLLHDHRLTLSFISHDGS